MSVTSATSPPADSAAPTMSPARVPRSADAPAIRASGLTKTYGARNAVDGVSITVPTGVIAGFVRPNGAGKTTTIRMLLGLIRPTTGTAEVLGVPTTEPAGYLPGVGALIEGPAFYPGLTARRNLEILATLGGIDRARVDPLLADGAALAAAALLAPGHGVSTTAWFSSAGTRSLLSNGGNMVLSTLAWGAVGAVLAVVLRSTAAAIAGGLAYALVAERLLVSVWPEGQTWLHGQVIDAIARGGNVAITYSAALLLLGLYLVVALVIAGALFWRRDVAA